MTSMSDASGSTAWDYSQFDVSGMVTQTTTISGLSYDVTKTQTPGGRITQLIYPSGRSVDYARTSCTCAVSGINTSLGGSTSTLLADLAYRPAGLPTAMDIGNSGTINVDNRYDEAGRLTIANPGTPNERSYSFDPNGNHVGIQLPAQPWMDQAYTYDSLGRIRSAVGGFGFVDFAYDKVGNRTRRTVNGQSETYSYVPGSNRIDRITGGSEGTVDFAYDGHGNTTQMGARSYGYDQANRLVHADVDGVVAQYVYNGLGQRVVKTVDGASTVFVYDMDGKMIAEMPGGDDGLGKEHLYNGKALLAQVDVESGAIFTYHTNYLGAVHQLTDNNGTVVWEGIYQPYGETTVNAGSVVINNWRMPGQYFDAETGLHYNYHRYYDIGIGRYLTPDPIGLEGGINLYAYTSNNPVNAIDPEGLKQFCNWDDIVIDHAEGKIYYQGELFAWKETDGIWYEADPGPDQHIWREDSSVEHSVVMDIAAEIVRRADRKDRIDIAISGVGVAGATGAFFASGGTSLIFTGIGISADFVSAARTNDKTNYLPMGIGFITQVAADHKIGKAAGAIASGVKFTYDLTKDK